jgi:hypothetical protein
LPRLPVGPNLLPHLHPHHRDPQPPSGLRLLVNASVTDSLNAPAGHAKDSEEVVLVADPCTAAMAAKTQIVELNDFWLEGVL